MFRFLRKIFDVKINKRHFQNYHHVRFIRFDNALYFFELFFFFKTKKTGEKFPKGIFLINERS